jgi:hypothetical protein
MIVTGSSRQSQQFLKNLDAQKLADLAADLLALRGHHGIKVVDGPGDGCRDIHSVDTAGHKFLTQSKFRGDEPKAASSREIGELPLGMVKLGYSKGLFVTNARISPQSKREFLNDYPELSLDFLEGSEIASIVLGNLILRAIWFDGVSIDRVSYVVVIPVLVRDLAKDRPLSLFPTVSESFQDRLVSIGQREVQLHLRQGIQSIGDFEPYRPPERRTIGEGWMPTVRSAEAVLSGVVPFDQLGSLRNLIAQQLFEHLAPRQVDHLAMRFAQPYLIPLSGDSPGARLQLDLSPITYVQHDGVTAMELDWLLPSADSGWHPPRRLEALSADWVRWHNADLDACLDLRVLSVPSRTLRGSIEEERAFLRKWWEQSTFALLPTSVIAEMKVHDLPAPSEVLEWYNDEHLCCWLHGNLSPGFRSMLIEAEDHRPDFRSPFEVDPDEARQFFIELTKRIERLGGTLIPPSRARHMIALRRSDPFPDTELIEYRSVNLLTHELPSPIEPSSRSTTLTFCWLLDQGRQVEIAPRLKETLDQIFTSSTDLRFSVRIDSESAYGAFFVVDIEPLTGLGMEKTDRALECLKETALPVVRQMEEALTKHFPNNKRATGEYWIYRIGVLL